MLPAAAAFLLLCYQTAAVHSFATDITACPLRINARHVPKRTRDFNSRVLKPFSGPQLQTLSLRSSKLHASSTHLENETLNLSKEEVEQSLDYLASIVRTHLKNRKATTSNLDISSDESKNDETDTPVDTSNPATSLAKNRFIDLTTTVHSEHILESLFTLAPPPSQQLIKYAIIALQSLLILAMQVGVKGGEEQQKKLVRHLFRRTDPPPPKDIVWISSWTSEDIRRLKFYRDGELGKRALAALKWKRTAVGAYELLIQMGVWGAEEEVSLLRSGFPVRFLDEEIECSLQAESNTHDPDKILCIRQDLSHHKVYTIDSESTQDIDDGISVEKIDDSNNAEQRLRYWIHIADVDRWAPRGSELLKVAERRGTSLYLPSMTLGMFPQNMASDTMSLTSNIDKCALSLGVELNSDGSIDASSIILTPSLIHVDYRLTYEQVDEMLDEGVGYTEEWEIGALLAAATKRREHRVQMGSSEGFIPYPIPKGSITVNKGDHGLDIELSIESTHNSGANMTAGKTEGVEELYDPYASPISSSWLIVTEMMILAGEAIGKWHQLQPMQKEDLVDGRVQLTNLLELPYRRQPAPDYKTRILESKQADFLLAMNKFYPHAWYCRRFFKPVQVSEEHGPHFGMGLDCYVQWSSPIRRLTDLQVHSALKRYLRRIRVNEMLLNGVKIPSEITSFDLGYDISIFDQENQGSRMKTVDPIDYKSGLGQIFAARPIQTSSANFWLFEYIRRRVEGNDSDVMFESVVLGCVDKERFQYAIYVYELGLEHRYLSESGNLEEGRRLWLRVTSVNPRLELLTFSLASRSGGLAN